MGARGPTAKTAQTPAIKFAPGVPPAPAWLDVEAVIEYERAAKVLTDADGSLQQADFHVLANYAQASADVGRLTKKIRYEGEVIDGPHGPVANPRLRALSQAQRALMGTIQQLGFSPAARARVPKSAASSKPDNPFAGFVK